MLFWNVTVAIMARGMYHLDSSDLYHKLPANFLTCVQQVRRRAMKLPTAWSEVKAKLFGFRHHQTAH